MIEKEIIDGLKIALAIDRVYYGSAPQESNTEPLVFPLVVINRVGSTWANSFCGVDVDLSMVDVQIDFYGNTGFQARNAADLARLFLSQYSLDSEISFYDEASRGWRVMQTWAVPDYTPVA